MITFLLGYALFAVTTSLASLYELVYPVISKQEKEVGYVANKYVMYFTFFIINILVAPIIFFSCIIPSFGLRFRFTLQEALFEKD